MIHAITLNPAPNKILRIDKFKPRIGNILTQWIGAGVVEDLRAARAICRTSREIQEFLPGGGWQEP